MKLASAKYYDELPTEGNEHGQAFRDVELEKELLIEAQNLGLGAQFGGKYFAHDIRVIRLPRHGASCPVGMGVSCSADRNIKAVSFCRSSTNYERNMIRRTGRRTQRAHLLNQVIFQFPRR